MAFRSRSEAFRLLRTDASRTHQGQPSESHSIQLLNDSRDTAPRPKWMACVDDVKGTISKLRIEVAELHSTAGRAAMPGFGEGKADEHEQTSERATNVTSLFKEGERALLQLPMCTSGTDSLVQQNAKNLLTAQLKDLATEYRAVYRAFQATTERQRMSIADDRSCGAASGAGCVLAGAAPRFNDLEAGEPSENDEEVVARAHTMLQVVIDIQDNERKAQEREEAIQKIGESVTELADMFKEVHCLVIEQGPLLDRIDYNVEQAAMRIEDAHGELKTAASTSKRMSKMWCIHVLALLVVSMAIVLALKHAALRR